MKFDTKKIKSNIQREKIENFKLHFDEYYENCKFEENLHGIWQNCSLYKFENNRHAFSNSLPLK